jgi:serine/threonine protein kinase
LAKARNHLKKKLKLGSYTLLREIGRGGNGVVWEATGDEGSVAIKILSSPSHLERFQRFRDEIKLLSGLREQNGILPILDYSLPERVSKRDLVWFVMPLAIPIVEALRDKAVVEIVSAVAEISDVLSSLASKEIYHRDIKPGNLYLFQDQWCVGDFGIADFPDKSGLTQSNRKLGPTHFMAPKMLFNPLVANSAVADVYSLAKTLWVLITGQNFPYQGQIRRDVKDHLLQGWRPFPQLSILDRLIERATSDEPNMRPSMREISKELRFWIQLVEKQDATTDFDSDVTVATVQSLVEPALRELAEREELKSKSQQLSEQLAAELTLLASVAEKLDLEVSKSNEAGWIRSRFMTETKLSSDQLLFEGGANITVLKRPSPCKIHAGVHFILKTNRQLVIGAACAVRSREFSEKNLIWIDKAEVLFESAEQALIIKRFVKGLYDNHQLALQVFSQLLSDYLSE